MKVAIVGATGFVGSVLTESLLDDPNIEVVPLIRSAGNAWSLARLGLDLRTVDLLEPPSVEKALQGCTHVVNCSRGNNVVMIKGLKTLIKQCQRQSVQKLVHLSSVAVYGDPPPADSVDELAATRPAKGSYGWNKLQQDKLVAAAARSGLSALTLCPPNITGPGSYFLIQLLGDIEAGRFVLSEIGNAPCSTVDVANLAHAIKLALYSDVTNRQRMFITDDAHVTWGQIVDCLIPLVAGAPNIATVSREELVSKRPTANKQRLSAIRTLKHLVSSDVRQALRQDPLLAVIDTGLRQAVGKLGTRVEGELRHFVSGPIRVPSRGDGGPQPDLGLSLQQLRGVLHSSERARKQIGYRPVVSFDDSMDAFSKWFRLTRGLDSEFADLCRQLE